MSIVLAAVTPDIAILKCDSRGTGEKGIAGEDFSKFKIINKYCVIGYAGSLTFIKIVMKKIMDFYSAAGITDEGITVSQFMNTLQKILVASQDTINYYKFDVNFIGIGLEEGKIILKAVGTASDYEITGRSPQYGTIDRVMASTNKTVNAPDLSVFMFDGCRLVDSMDNYIKYIATIDESVNTNIKTVVLRREKGVCGEDELTGENII